MSPINFTPSEAAQYFDNAATTPLDPKILNEMLPYLGEAFGNANSLHGFGRRASAAIETARERVASLVGAEDPHQVLFTSGATEANNQVLNSFSRLAVSPFEHSSVREPARARFAQVLENHGFKVLAPTNVVDLVSVMRVNNETGTVLDLPTELSETQLVHSDITQALGKIPVSMHRLSFATCSAHKLYGPKGVGAVVFAEEPPHAWNLGGEQEHGLRGGTLNVPAIVGFGAACVVAADEMDANYAHAEICRAVLLEQLAGCTDWQINGGSSLSPYILSLSFYGLEGETLVIELDRLGFAVSSGAACSSGSNEPSHVLQSAGLEPEWSRGTVRVSFGKFNTAESSAQLGIAMRRIVENLRRQF